MKHKNPRIKTTNTIKIVLEVQDNKAELFMEFIKDLSFVKKAEIAAPNEILNPRLLQSIENYETGKVKPTPCSLAELKEWINASS